VVLLLAVLTAFGLTTPLFLLLFTLIVGFLFAAATPTYQAIVHELVPRDELRPAIALNGVAINGARAIGPAIAGLMIGAAGVATVFALNALSFLLVVIALLRWKRDRTISVAPAERLVGAIRAGTRYMRASLEFRAVLTRTALFAMPAAVIWALLPLVARIRLAYMGAFGYGALVGMLGFGATVAMTFLPTLSKRLSTDHLIAAGSIVFAVMLLVLAVATQLAPLLGAMFIAGLAWLSVLSCLNAAAQQLLSEWVRARGLGVYGMVMQGSLALGSAVWGAVADATTVRDSLVLAAAAAAAGGILGLKRPLAKGEALDLHPAVLWPEPYVLRAVQLDEGPVLVEIAYRINPGDADPFVLAAGPLRRLRLRDGATRWMLYEDPAESGRFVESFLVDSWAEHLRQHARATESDRQTEEGVRRFQVTDEPVKVSHLVARPPK
jgi:MFS family permease